MVSDQLFAILRNEEMRYYNKSDIKFRCRGEKDTIKLDILTAILSFSGTPQSLKNLEKRGLPVSDDIMIHQLLITYLLFQTRK